MADEQVPDVILFRGVDVQTLNRDQILEALRVGYDELLELRGAMSEEGRLAADREEDFQRNLLAQHDYFGTVAEYQSRLMDASSAYNQIIILGGYVAFFGVWSAVKDDIPRWILFGSGGAMLLSLIVFIGWTVFGMFQLQTQNMRTLKTFSEGVEGFEDRFRAAIASGLQNTGWLHKFWLWVVIAAGSSGFVAASLLSYGALTSIFEIKDSSKRSIQVVARPAQEIPHKPAQPTLPQTASNRQVRDVRAAEKDPVARPNRPSPASPSPAPARSP